MTIAGPRCSLVEFSPWGPPVEARQGEERTRPFPLGDVCVPDFDLLTQVLPVDGALGSCLCLLLSFLQAETWPQQQRGDSCPGLWVQGHLPCVGRAGGCQQGRWGDGLSQRFPGVSHTCCLCTQPFLHHFYEVTVVQFHVHLFPQVLSILLPTGLKTTC